MASKPLRGLDSPAGDAVADAALAHLLVLPYIVARAAAGTRHLGAG
ncbi:hypothetical protein [Streptomyces sp. NBC_00080]